MTNKTNKTNTAAAAAAIPAPLAAQVRTAAIPFAGFYYSCIQGYIDDEISRDLSEYFDSVDMPEELRRAAGLNQADGRDLHYDFNGRAAAETISRDYFQWFIESLESISGYATLERMKFKELYQPAAYNFENDKIYCDVSLSLIHDLYNWIEEKRPGLLAETVEKELKPADGFIPFYSNRLSDWGNIDGWETAQYSVFMDAVGAVMMSEGYPYYSNPDDENPAGELDREYVDSSYEAIYSAVWENLTIDEKDAIEHWAAGYSARLNEEGVQLAYMAGHFLPALVNSDPTGVDPDDLKALDRWEREYEFLDYITACPGSGIEAIEPEFNRDSVTGLMASCIPCLVKYCPDYSVKIDGRLDAWFTNLSEAKEYARERQKQVDQESIQKQEDLKAAMGKVPYGKATWCKLSRQLSEEQSTYDNFLYVSLVDRNGNEIDPYSEE